MAGGVAVGAANGSEGKMEWPLYIGVQTPEKLKCFAPLQEHNWKRCLFSSTILSVPSFFIPLELNIDSKRMQGRTAL